MARNFGLSHFAAAPAPGVNVVPFARPLPPRRAPALPLALGTRVAVTPPQDHPGRGTVRAVVHRPGAELYDVLTDDGRYLRDLPAARLRPEP